MICISEYCISSLFNAHPKTNSINLVMKWFYSIRFQCIFISAYGIHIIYNRRAPFYRIKAFWNWKHSQRSDRKSDWFCGWKSDLFFYSYRNGIVSVDASISLFEFGLIFRNALKFKLGYSSTGKWTNHSRVDEW